MSILIIKSGTTSIEGGTVKGDFTYFSATTKGLGATIDTGFWSGVDPTCDGYTVYKIGGQHGWAAMVATGREQLNYYLKLFGGTGTTVDENVTWATNANNIFLHSGSTGPCPTVTPSATQIETPTPTQTPTSTPTPTYSGVCNTYYFGIDTFPGEATTFGYYEFPSGTYTQINITAPDAIFANAYNYPGVFYVNGDTGYTIENYGPCGLLTPTPTATSTQTPTNTPTETNVPVTPTPTPTTSLLSWSFTRDSGTGTYDLYINNVNVEARSSTSNGFITVSVGDEIYVNAFAGSCAGGTSDANLAVTGIIIGAACQASSVSLTTGTYTVTSANIGQTIVLSTLAQCLNGCL
jgi:hypothetical protein